MLTRLLVATGNPGKLAEIQRFFEGMPVELATVHSVLGRSHDVDEVGTTFGENALLKALSAARLTGMLALGDDSGLEVDALGGRPGVRSARYAGEHASDAENNRLLLHELTGVPDTERTARFRCAVALAEPSGRTHSVAGVSVEGIILHAPRGDGGFGYDPLFAVPVLGGRSFAELLPAQKEQVSHRGQALRNLRVLLEDLLSSR